MEYFNSPTYGRLNFHGVLEKIINYINVNPEKKYRIVIGTDSQLKNSKRYDFVKAIVVHRVGSGGVYFWQRLVQNKRYVLYQRIYEEALMSLELAEKFIKAFCPNDISDYALEIHVDIGRVGETREMINEVVGMVRGQGFEVKTKPEAYGAACVADKYT
ncbi:ribonuclease H-like YkuK family protein [Patescibacteria group bacterium]|nr:ribonuclease H-like YkuK family protein [Patescibacteria group bacterium]